MVEHISVESAPKAIGPYSQGIVYGDLVFLSGQTPVNPSTGKIDGKNIKEQVQQVIDNIDNILCNINISQENVLKTTCFLADMNDFNDFNEVYGQYFKSKPSRSCVAVKQLPMNALCEIEIVAVRK